MQLAADFGPAEFGAEASAQEVEGASSSGLRGASSSVETTSRAEVLRAFGLLESDLPAIRAEGERLLGKDADEGPQESFGSDCDGASQSSEAPDRGPC